MDGGGSQLIFLLLMAGLLVFMVSRTRKQQRAQQEMQSSVAPGAEVVTTSGTYGTVVAIEDDVVVLEIAPGVRTRWARRAVARVVPTTAAPDALGAPGAQVAGEGVLNLDKPEPSTPGDAPENGSARS